MDKRNIVVAWAENCSGPGWRNTLIWYIERLPDGKLEQNCLQPEEQTRDMLNIFSYSAMSASQLTNMVSNKLNKDEKKCGKPLKEGHIKKGGVNQAPKKPKLGIKPPAQKPTGG